MNTVKEIYDELKDQPVKSSAELEQLLQPLLMTAKREYQRGVNRDLSRHFVDGVFSRQLLINAASMLSLTEPYVESCLQQDKDHRQEVLSEAERITGKMVDALTDAALKHNHSSCALSNFPDEHHPSPETFKGVLVQLEGLRRHWRQQVIQAA